MMSVPQLPSREAFNFATDDQWAGLQKRFGKAHQYGVRFTTDPDECLRALSDWETEQYEKWRAAQPRNPKAEKGYAQAALTDETRLVRTAPDGFLNPAINDGGFKLGTLVGAGQLDFSTVVAELRSAAIDNGYGEDRLIREDLPERAIRKGMEHPRDMSTVKGTNGTDTRRKSSEPTNGHVVDFEERTLKLEPLSGVRKRKATWAWEYDDAGRIQHGVLTMFAGRPGAGKSTAARWFASRLTRGELDGCWKGRPVNVAVLMTEEQTDVIVVPGLDAAGADISRVFRPKVQIGESEMGLAISDLSLLTQQLRANDVHALIVDPMMSLFDKDIDINRANQVRAYLEPFSDLAKAIDGIVIGVTHLNKSQLRDILANINGSSAFGEVPRCVFGFAHIENGEHIMEQAKNSAGQSNLALTYQLPITDVETDDGPTQLTRFNITGTSEMSIADLSDNQDGEDATTLGAAAEWLKFYLLENQPASSTQVKSDAKAAGITERTLHRARKRLSVRINAVSLSGKPHTTVWVLP